MKANDAAGFEGNNYCTKLGLGTTCFAQTIQGAVSGSFFEWFTCTYRVTESSN